MTTEVEALESAARQLADIEPELVAGHDGHITYPYLKNVQLSNFVRFYHPDGTHSDLACPTYNPQRPTPWRERKILYYLKKRRDGKQWFFLTPQAPEPERPYRCFVVDGTGQQCTKRLGNLSALFSHVQTRHFEEAKMYGELLQALSRKMQMNLDPNLLKELGIAPPVADGHEPDPEYQGKVGQPVPVVYYCRIEGCPRFFDSEDARKRHETGHQKEAT